MFKGQNNTRGVKLLILAVYVSKYDSSYRVLIQLKDAWRLASKKGEITKIYFIHEEQI